MIFFLLQRGNSSLPGKLHARTKHGIGHAIHFSLFVSENSGLLVFWFIPQQLPKPSVSGVLPNAFWVDLSPKQSGKAWKSHMVWGKVLPPHVLLDPSKPACLEGDPPPSWKFTQSRSISVQKDRTGIRTWPYWVISCMKVSNDDTSPLLGLTFSRNCSKLGIL